MEELLISFFPSKKEKNILQIPTKEYLCSKNEFSFCQNLKYFYYGY